MAQTDAQTEWRRMTHEEALCYLDYMWRLYNTDKPQPDEDGYETLRPDQPAEMLLELLELDAEDFVQGDEDLYAVVFGANKDADVWKQIAGAAQIRDLAAILASRIDVPVVRPVHIAGMTSWEAGVFRAVLATMASSGIAIDRVRPSTELDSYIAERPEVFNCKIARLAPAQMPPIRLEFSGWAHRLDVALHVVLIAIFICGVVGFPILWFVGYSICPAVGAWIAAFLLLGVVGWPLDRRKSTNGRAGEFRTFHDLCSALAVRFRDDDHRSV